MAAVRFGIFEDFKSAETLLIWSDEVGLAHFLSALRQLADAQAQMIAMHQMSWAEPLRKTEFYLTLASEGRASLQLKSGSAGPIIELRGSAGTFSEFADKVDRLLAALPEGGHQYLIASAALQLMVSIGEYSLEMS